MSEQNSYQYRASIKRTYHTAQQIIPLLIDFIGVPESVVDLGGGGGGWLKAFQDKGTKQVYLFDDPCINLKDLLISPENFTPYNLNQEIPKPIKCDLAISTEFAEHVNYKMSEKIVDFLTQSSQVVLFSAAIPRQGRQKEHINEQRPDFWKKLFQKRGYERVDLIRSQILFDENIPFWFRQNLYLYVDKNYLTRSKLATVGLFIPDDFELVHTSTLNDKLRFREVLKEIIPAFSRMVKSRLKLPK